MQTNYFSMKMVVIEQFCNLEKDSFFVSTKIKNSTPKNRTAQLEDPDRI